MSIYNEKLPSKAEILLMMLEHLKRENQKIEDKEEAGESEDIILLYRAGYETLQKEYSKIENMDDECFQDLFSSFKITSTMDGLLKMSIRIEYILSLLDKNAEDKATLHGIIMKCSSILNFLAYKAIPSAGAEIDIQARSLKTL
jgi:hypothetical protein